MKRVLRWLLLVVVLLAGCGQVGGTASDAPVSTSSVPTYTPTQPGVTVVEIIALSHLPAQNVVSKVKEILATYGSKVSVTEYDFNSPEGADFAKAKGLTEHMPVAIFINGSREAVVGGKLVTFSNFPGLGWSIEEFQQALDQAIGK